MGRKREMRNVKEQESRIEDGKVELSRREAGRLVESRGHGEEKNRASSKSKRELY